MEFKTITNFFPIPGIGDGATCYTILVVGLLWLLDCYIGSVCGSRFRTALTTTAGQVRIGAAAMAAQGHYRSTRPRLRV